MNKDLQLRALEPEDLELIFQIENDRDLWKWSAGNVPLSRYAVRQYLEQQQNDIYLDGQLRLVAELEGQAVGIVDLTDFEPRHFRAEVGIVVLPPYRRQGVGTMALQKLQTYAADVLHLRSLHAHVATGNMPALALFRTLGYREAGLLRRWLEGEADVCLLQLML